MGRTDSACLAPAGGGRAGFKSDLRHGGAPSASRLASQTLAYFSVERSFSRGAWGCARHQGYPDGHSMALVFKAGVGAGDEILRPAAQVRWEEEYGRVVRVLWEDLWRASH